MGKCSKTEGMVFGEFGRWEDNFEKKKGKPHKCHPKMNLYRESHPNRTMGKCSKIGKMFFGKGGEFGEGGRREGRISKNIHTSQAPSQNESM